MSQLIKTCSLCGSKETELGGPESHLCKACGYWENELGARGIVSHTVLPFRITKTDILDGPIGWGLLVILVLLMFLGAGYLTVCHCIQYPSWAQGG